VKFTTAGSPADIGISSDVTVKRQFPTAGTYDYYCTVHGTVRGPITCPEKALQQVDASVPCYGDKASRDTFKPNVAGVDAILSRTMLSGQLGAYAGMGYNWLSPRFQAHFLEGTGVLDNTKIEVDLGRVALFSGAEYRVRGRWSATAQLYAFPQDVALFRVGAAASVGGR
jgi:hypothetical protein